VCLVVEAPAVATERAVVQAEKPGGEVPILIKMKGQEVSVVEGMGTAPMKATREFFVNRAKDQKSGNPQMATMSGARSGAIPSTGPLAATVPAVLDACVVALDQFGTKSLAEVMQPAIQLADGFPLDELRVQYIKNRSKVFSQWTDARRVFLPNGQTPEVGDVFVQADLARTLREIVNAEKRAARKERHAGLMAARDYFYKGPIGRRAHARWIDCQSKPALSPGLLVDPQIHVAFVAAGAGILAPWAAAGVVRLAALAPFPAATDAGAAFLRSLAFGVEILAVVGGGLSAETNQQEDT